MDSLSKINNQTRLTTYFLGFISTVLIVYLLSVLRVVLIPVVISIFLTFLFHPIVLYLRQFRIPRWFSLFLIILGILSTYYLLGALIFSNYLTFIEKSAFYEANFNKIFEQIFDLFGITNQQFAKIFKLKTTKYDINFILQSILNIGFIQDVFELLAVMFQDILVILIFWSFMILGKEKFEKRIQIAFLEKGELISKNIINIDKQLQSYIFVKTVISLVMGLSVTFILYILDVDFASIWGILTFILNFIPNLGALLSTILPVLTSILQFGIGWRSFFVFILIFLIHNILGNIVEPHFFGKKMKLSPVFVLFSLIFWGWVWGITGMFLAVPIAAIIKILFSNIEPLKPFAILLGSNESIDQKI